VSCDDINNRFNQIIAIYSKRSLYWLDYMSMPSEYFCCPH